MSALLAQVVVMAGPSGSGKSHLAESSGLALMQAEAATVQRPIELGCRPCDRHATAYALRHAARGEGLWRPSGGPG